MSKTNDAVIGLAVGDAIGVPIETYKREELTNNKITKMCGYMAHPFPKGYFSDDTSLTIATLDSISELGYFDYNRIMDNFVLWYKVGKYTPSNVAFGIGNTCKMAILDYINNGGNAIECGINNINNNGNGSIMRILPAALYCYYKESKNNETYEISKNLSSLTHAHEISVLGCYLMTEYLINLLSEKDKYESYKCTANLNLSMFSYDSIKMYKRFLDGSLLSTSENDISSLWYVVDTFESSIYSLINTENYKDAIIKAINLGGDTDTVGAVTGAMAGILYGEKNIPSDWLNDLVKKEYLENVCNNFERKLNKKYR